MAGKTVWAVLMSRQAELAKAFYGASLGWRYELLCSDPYPCWVARNSDGRSVAAVIDSSASDFPDAAELWLPYFVLPDLHGRIAEAERLGATLLRPPFQVPVIGKVAILRQPGGGIVGWIAAAET